MIKIHFTKSKHFSSKILKWFTGDDVSHVAVEWNRIVYHSTLSKGVHISWKTEFMKEYEIVKTVVLDIKREAIISSLDHHIGEKYDILGYIYLAFRTMLNEWFKIPMPTSNRYQESGAKICMEIAGDLINEAFKKEVDWSAMTPQVMLKVLANEQSY